jgi:hypothetical protein
MLMPVATQSLYEVIFESPVFLTSEAEKRSNHSIGFDTAIARVGLEIMTSSFVLHGASATGALICVAHVTKMTRIHPVVILTNSVFDLGRKWLKCSNFYMDENVSGDFTFSS